MFEKLLDNLFPRILTQVCRDSGSPFFGSFDRNWWHYKIRDFSSIIIQQGGYFSYLYAGFNKYNKYKVQLEEIARASVFFWAKRAIKHGAFEEYYPWEKGYPPTAFSTLAMAKLIEKLDLSDPTIDKALQVAAKQLINRFEPKAANQQVAGLAALAVIKRIRPQLVSDQKFEQLANKTLDLQNSEGWFVEYDGPDLGYLSVTMDCLWDLYDYTDNQKFYDANVKALNYLAPFVDFASSNIGMHNARNTDYIVPYGISRFLNDPDKNIQKQAMRIFQNLYDRIDDDHFFLAIDDRYWIHYIGHSVARAQLLLNEQNNAGNITSKIENVPDSVQQIFPHAGQLIFNKKQFKILVSVNKGGILTVKNGDAIYSNFGWLVSANNKQYVTHWWDQDWDWKIVEDRVIISGYLVPHLERESTPLKHMILRITSLIFGNKIITKLKNQLIFKAKKSQFLFNRSIELNEDSIVIKDSINGIHKNYDVELAPRSSKRHVASADSYQKEDFLLNRGFEVIEQNHVNNNIFESEIVITGCTTNYT